jgi:HD-GYP domain-containing protein (c-di-GMP phosphodiesterase class II)
METIKELLDRFDQLNSVGAALSKEHHLPRLLEQILIAAQDLTHADGGTVYLLDDVKKALTFEIMRTNSMGIAMGGTTGRAINFPPLSLIKPDGQPNNALVATYTALNDKTVTVADAYFEQGFDFSGTRGFDKATGYRSQSFLTVPLKNHENTVIGVLQLINAKDPKSGQTIPFSTTNQRLAESLASQASVALSNRQLIEQLTDLFEALVNLINAAIDEKSPYTSGHCQRVPEMTMMLAEATEAMETGPYADFTMTDKDRYELRLAGLLHDCGKIVTPVHVVDKATKLQTLFDRIELVETRFELLKRDAHIRLLEAQLALPAGHAASDALALQQAYAQDVATLNEQCAFLRRSNTGSEFMSAEEHQRVKDIAVSRTWQNAAGQTLPLLSDNEVENLCIRAGTLTQAEREIINNHIVATNKMLAQLPWPRHLRNVGEYAGGHHERMDGKGYPKGLKKEQMSLQARMMGIADIFEALTAGDRPYKSAMKLSQALSILAKMAATGHIDPDLFEIFIVKKAYMTYADRFLSADQVDEVSEAGILEMARAG